MKIHERFRGYFPVVIDVETGGFNPNSDALLEIAAVTLKIDEHDRITPDKSYLHHINPFPNANIDPKSLEFTGIDPYHPFRFAVDELEALKDIFQAVRGAMKTAHCQRAVLVGHNAHFDLDFLNAAVARCQLKNKNPFHPFTCFDTATLSALAFGQTVLAKAIECAQIPFDPSQAHSAIYDADRTAELFCYIINLWQESQ